MILLQRILRKIREQKSYQRQEVGKCMGISLGSIRKLETSSYLDIPEAKLKLWLDALDIKEGLYPWYLQYWRRNLYYQKLVETFPGINREKLKAVGDALATDSVDPNILRPATVKNIMYMPPLAEAAIAEIRNDR